jgi:hypothetical protein
VTECSYAGKEKVGDVEAHHIKYKQPQFDWELWVAATGKPVVVKMATKQSGPGGSANYTETYSGWKFDAEPGKDTFTFKAPEGAKKVDLPQNQGVDK